MSVTAKPELDNLEECPHGVISDEELRELGLSRGEVIDFSASTNPLGPSPRVAAAVVEADIGRYPDPEATALRTALATKLGVAAQNIVVGNGSAELMWLVALAYVRPGDPVLIIGPTFGEYERASRIVGAKVIHHIARAQEAFTLDIAQVCQSIRACQPRLIFLCNPNNPTGLFLQQSEVEELIDASPDSLLVIDEAYRAFVAEPWPSEALIQRGNVLLLRSMTKDYALAGLRLGYALGSPPIAAALRKVRPPWNVNAMAQSAGVAALEDDEHLERSREVVREAKAFLVAELSRLGFKVLPGAANFLLVEVGDAASFRTALLKQGLCVRDCTSFGLPQFIRIGVRTLPECQRLIQGVVGVVKVEPTGHSEVPRT